jgi:hypothetical protein
MVDDGMRGCELDTKLDVLLYDVIDGNQWCNGDATRLRVLSQRSRCITLDCLIVEVGNKLGHVIRILICIIGLVIT